MTTIPQDTARALLAVAAQKAEQHLISEMAQGKGQRSIKLDAFTGLTALAVYTIAVVQFGSSANWVRQAATLTVNTDVLQQTCAFLADLPEYQPSKDWPWTKEQMSAALHEEDVK